MEESRVDTLSAIENISAVTEETSSASETLVGNLDELVKEVKELLQYSAELKGNAENLNDKIQVFKI